jgi:hypothetical protein
LVKSPVPPKITITQGAADLPELLFTPFDSLTSSPQKTSFQILDFGFCKMGDLTIQNLKSKI